MEDNWEEFAGSVSEIIFQNEDNGYTVFDIESADGEELVTAVGCIPYLKAGEMLKLYGRYTNHPSYGSQLKVEQFERIVPTTRSAILDYLSSGIVKGVRRRTALKIVEVFGEDTLEVMLHSPERLAQVPGISREKAVIIGEAYAQRQAVQGLVMFLQGYHVSPSLALRAYKALGTDAVGKIKRNPYVLSELVPGITFTTADGIARAMGIDPNNPDRIKAGVKYVLYLYAGSGGHTYLPRDILVNLCVRTLGVDELEVENGVVTLLMEQELKNDYIDDEECIFLKALYQAELSSSRIIRALAAEQFPEQPDVLDADIRAAEAETGVTLAPAQREAVAYALTSGFVVITGGPGTGKTTAINTIIKVMELRKLRVALAAPTGRASKRMSAVTGKDAKTLHRLLEIGFSDDEGIQEFKRNDQFPLDYDCIIVDEVSMVDALLMDAFLKAVKQGTRVVLVGDADQLPSVGAGNVLKDIIASETVPVVRLSTIFRQAEESMIVVNAHRINHGELPVYNAKDKDFFFVNGPTGEHIARKVVELVETRLPKAYGFDPMRDIQVVTPMKKSPAGVLELNGRLQAALNPASVAKKERAYLRTTFREGDRVMQMRNNYDAVWERLDSHEEGTGVYNGDMGFIEKIDGKNIIVVFDDDKRVVYESNAMDELTLAYAVTVHKSQGSEFRAVVMPVFHGAPMLMNRNLLYTAVTRARELVVLVGQPSAVERMVANNTEARRYSSLCRRLREA